MINTLLYAKRLEDAGMPRPQAQAQVQILTEVTETNLATKQDLRELEYRLVIKLGTIATVVASLAVGLAVGLSKLI